ncbi:MAG: hypothetical protein WC862_02380 [Patescibacteria group bacterium]
MKKIVAILNVIVALYFFALANLLFWISFLVLSVGIFFKSELQLPKESVLNSMIDMILFAPFLIYGSIMFFRKTESKYSYGLILLFIIWAESQIYRFFFVTGIKLETTDFKNLVFFGVPFLVVYLTKYLDSA